ncbi:MAG: hypothetical protein SYR96_40025 [Actinomycetota bacterium]|nr:hypothetical protein [Actinomycetota bacterium]
MLVAAFAQLLTAGQDPLSFDVRAINPTDGLPIGDLGGISGEHWLGVEPLTGRDLFARLVVALQFSLGLAFGAAVVEVLLGLVVAIVVRRGGVRAVQGRGYPRDGQHGCRGLLRPALMYAALLVPLNLLVEVWFGYQGVGLRPPPEPSWGGMLADATLWFRHDPAYLLVPGSLLMVTVTSFLLLAAGLSGRSPERQEP